LPTASALEGRKRYVLAGRRAPGVVQIDAGAAQALQRGGSLLPVGVIAVSGRFQRGDTVRIAGPDGQELARGLSNYAADDLRRIQGQRSEAIEPTLGYFFGDEVVHHNNMVLL
jgi:glutamate 5-kinase